VYSALLFLPTVQTCCSEGEDGYEDFFDEEFYAKHYPSYYSCGVMKSSAVPLHQRVALVFRDIICVINIL
jgi:hypothetical protein